VKTLRPTVWLTEDFPLSVDEFLPLLDILATRVRAVRRLRELLTTKFPPGTFPVKVTFSLLPCSSENASSCANFIRIWHSSLAILQCEGAVFHRPKSHLNQAK
jgi:hypothetical protein